MKIRIFCLTILSALAPPLLAAPLAESTFTEVVKDVNVVAAANKTTAPAKVRELFKAPDLVRTGAGSRAELTAPDQTITRIGANTVFSFEPTGRNIKLEQGSILFHSPAGKGGGTIKTGGASAAVLGTTIIVAATVDGGFKLIVLEGTARATLPDGQSITLHAGQMVFILPAQRGFSQVLDFNLDRLVNGSQLINGFAQPLPSAKLIGAAVQKQKRDLAKGKARDTGISADEAAGSPQTQNGPDAIDQSSYQTAVHVPLNAGQIVLIQQSPAGGGSGGRNNVPVHGLPP